MGWRLRTLIIFILVNTGQEGGQKGISPGISTKRQMAVNRLIRVRQRDSGAASAICEVTKAVAGSRIPEEEERDILSLVEENKPAQNRTIASCRRYFL